MSDGSDWRRLRKLFLVKDFIESNIRLALILVLKGLIERVQSPIAGIFFDLAVPSVGVEMREPSSQLGKVVSGKLRDSALDVLDGAHAGSLNRSLRRARV